MCDQKEASWCTLWRIILYYWEYWPLIEEYIVKEGSVTVNDELKAYHEFNSLGYNHSKILADQKSIGTHQKCWEDVA